MKAAVVVLNFGEPERPTMEQVVPFLERIFSLNAPLEGGRPGGAARRSRELAEQRAPGLIEEYEAIGGSPMNAQARAQTQALEDELRRRGHDVVAYDAMQFTDPSIPDAVARARDDGVGLLVGLPVYPLCGPSTNVAALAALADAVRALGWDVPLREIGGWHTHPDYTALRADGIRRVVQDAGLDLNAADTTLVFSAHGTPMKYLREGSRYDVYVDDHCRALAAAVGADDYVIGYQNHGNRPGVEWTQPDIDAVIEDVDAKRVVVVPVSFMHEQSETLSELDIELREEAEARGLEFHRVPVPHDDPRFIAVLADLVEPWLDERASELDFGPCRCRRTRDARCLNYRLERSELVAGD